MKKIVLLALIFCAGPGVVFAKNVWIEAYPGAGSVRVGEALDIHVSANVNSVRVYARRVPALGGWLKVKGYLRASEHPVESAQPWRDGANWPVAVSFVIPQNWEPGLYEFRVHQTSDPSHYVQFLVAVQPEESGSYGKVAVLTNEPTSNAYNNWGGKSNYGSKDAGGSKLAHVLSFSRPGAYEYRDVDREFPEWANRMGINAEYITSLQLHYEYGLLDAYDVLVLAGHSEYWSREMRLELERFLERGGKLISLSGNTMWWAVRFESTPTGIQMISCKGWVNPDCPQDPDLYTGYWREMGNPETRVMGASYEFGGYVDRQGYYMEEDGYGGYFVQQEKHWFWKGTGVANGDHVGQEAGVAGYEADAPPLISFGSFWYVDPTAPDLPESINVLATTPAAKPSSEGFGAVIHFPYGINGGEVFNCGSIDCPYGLNADPVWSKAILNVFFQFRALKNALIDTDWDGVNDAKDNCVIDRNVRQLDMTADGTGDKCDQHCH